VLYGIIIDKDTELLRQIKLETTEKLVEAVTMILGRLGSRDLESLLIVLSKCDEETRRSILYIVPEGYRESLFSYAIKMVSWGGEDERELLGWMIKYDYAGEKRIYEEDPIVKRPLRECLNLDSLPFVDSVLRELKSRDVARDGAGARWTRSPLHEAEEKKVDDEARVDEETPLLSESKSGSGSGSGSDSFGLRLRRRK